MELPRDTPEMDLVYQYAEAWNRLELDGFASYLAADVTYTSQHVFDELRGRDEVESHLRGKMETIRQSTGNQVRAEIGLCGDQRGATVQVLEAAEGRPCVLMQQGESSEPVVLALLDVEDGEVKEIGICTVAPHPSTAHRTGIYPGSAADT